MFYEHYVQNAIENHIAAIPFKYFVDPEHTSDFLKHNDLTYNDAVDALARNKIVCVILDGECCALTGEITENKIDMKSHLNQALRTLLLATKRVEVW